MAKRGRVPGRKSLGVKHSKNKNAKLSPFQRETKRNQLANQAPYAHHQKGGGRGSAGLRDEPVNARSLMSFLKTQKENKEARRVERQQIKMKLQNEMLDDVTPCKEVSHGDVSMKDGENEEVQENEEVDRDSHGSVSDDSEINSDEETGDVCSADMGNGKDPEDDSKQKIRENIALMNLKLSNKQLKKMMKKTERLAYIEAKNKEDEESKIEGRPKSTKLSSKREGAIRKALLSKELKASDKIIIGVMKRSGLFPDITSDKIKTGAELLSKKKLKDAVQRVTDACKKAHKHGMVLDLNEEMLVEGGFVGDDDNTEADGSIMLHGTAYDEATAVTLRRKEKKHIKKMVKKKGERAEKLSELTDEVNRLTSKTNIKKQRKLARASAEDRFEAELYEKQAKEKLRRDRESGQKRSREDGDENINDSSTDGGKRTLKRLSGLTTEQIQYREMLDDRGKIVERVPFGERTVAPPVFDSVPDKNVLSSINKLAAKLRQQQTSAAQRNSSKASRKAAEAQAEVSLLPRLNMGSVKEDSLYEMKRLAKLGLQGPVTETVSNHSAHPIMGASEKSISRAAAKAVSHNTNNDKIQNEFEGLRQRVMESYRHSRHIAAQQRKQERQKSSSYTDEKGHKKVNTNASRFDAVLSLGLGDDGVKGSFSGFTGKGNKHISHFVVGGAKDDDDNDIDASGSRLLSRRKGNGNVRGRSSFTSQGKQITRLRN